MTSNQIAFAKLQEDIKHNRATESATVSANEELQRHNREQERINWYVGSANYEVGMAQTHTQRLAQQETARHNAAMEDFERLETWGDYNRANAQADLYNEQREYYDLQGTLIPVQVGKTQAETTESHTRAANNVQQGALLDKQNQSYWYGQALNGFNTGAGLLRSAK